MNGPVEIRRLLTPTDAEIQGLAEVLIDCVDGGASVSFMRPLPLDKAAALLARRRGTARRWSPRAPHRRGRAGHHRHRAIDLRSSREPAAPRRSVEDAGAPPRAPSRRRRGAAAGRGGCSPASSGSGCSCSTPRAAMQSGSTLEPDGSGWASFRASRCGPKAGSAIRHFFIARSSRRRPDQPGGTRNVPSRKNAAV